VLRKPTRELGELRRIAALGPADGELWEVAARGLHRAHRTALEAGDEAEAARWLADLHKLTRRKGASDSLKAWVADALRGSK
jgi:hypothetical protein